MAARAWTAMSMITLLIFCTGVPQASDRVPSTWTRSDWLSRPIRSAMLGSWL